MNGPRIRELESFIQTNETSLNLKKEPSIEKTKGMEKLISDLEAVVIIQLEQAREELKRLKG